MLKRIGKWALIALGALAVVITGLVAFTPRDHKVELIITFSETPPSEVWRVMTDHAAEPNWIGGFGRVERLDDNEGRPVWRRVSQDGTLSTTIMTIQEVPERRYEFLLLRDDQPRSQSWDGRWVFELEAHGQGTRMRITEYGWTGGFVFFLLQRYVMSPDAFLRYYARRMGVALGDAPEVQVLRSH